MQLVLSLSQPIEVGRTGAVVIVLVARHAVRVGDRVVVVHMAGGASGRGVLGRQGEPGRGVIRECPVGP